MTGLLPLGFRIERTVICVYIGILNIAGCVLLIFGRRG